MESSLLCVQCPKTFKGKKSLQDHTRYHEVKQFSCHVCDKTFNTRTKYQNHLSVFEESIFQCDDECEKTLNIKLH